MKYVRNILVVLLLLVTIKSNAQIPYFGSSIEKGHAYAYFSVNKYKDTNSLNNYNAFQYGITNKFTVGTDIYNKYIGYTVRLNVFNWKYFTLGAQTTSSFDLDNNHKFSYQSTGIFINGGDKLGYAINYWITDLDKIEQWYYLRYTYKFISIYPGIILNDKINCAIGLSFNINKVNIYSWLSDRVTLGIDFTL